MKTTFPGETVDLLDSKLIDTLNQMGLEWEGSPHGIWITLRRGSGCIHFAENAASTRFYTWCDNPSARTVQAFLNPRDAIQAGLRRCSSV